MEPETAHTGNAGSPASRLRGLALDLVAAPLEAQGWVTAAAVAGMLGGLTVLTFVVGGTSVIPLHLFYVPIAIAGARFGVGAAVLTGIAAGLLVGPAMPADVANSIAQETSDWAVRTVFFVLLGALITLLMRRTARGVIQERDYAATTRRLEGALEQSQLRLHFQPIVAASTGEVTGAEALLRWESPDEGLVAAQRIVPAAESTGHIIPIGSWVIDQACKSLNTWSGVLDEAPFVMSVNVAPAQLYEDNLVRTVLDALDRHGIDPSRICLEITESSVIEDIRGAITVLTELRKAGVSIAIDDFGSGLSSLSYLRYLPFDTIKIDGHFLRDLEGNPEAQTLIRNVARIAQDLDKQAVAEQVETGFQWDNVVHSGCTHGQGYFFSPPLPAAAFSTLLGSRQIWPTSRFKLTT